jgi:hypothetical protein
MCVVCDSCEQEITDPNTGFTVVGNIGAASPNPDQFLGLIGNNFPPSNSDGLIHVDNIKARNYCKTCFLKALGLEN